MTPRNIISEFQNRGLKKHRICKFDNNHRCIFVLSTGRTGTKTLATLISLSKDYLSYHEAVPKLFRLSRLAYSVEAVSEINDVLKEAFLIARRDLLEYSLKCGRGYAETGNHVTFLAKVIHETIPEARFIHLVRDPRSVIRSGMRRNWYANSPYDYIRITPKNDSEIADKWKYFSSFQKNVWLWNETNKWIIDFMSIMPYEKALLIHSEELFDRNEETLIRLYDFLGTQKPSNRRINLILKKKLNIQKTGEFPVTQDWSRSMVDDFIQLAGNTARALNYDF